MADREELPQLIPPHGGYRELQSYQMAEIVYETAFEHALRNDAGRLSYA